MRNGEAAVRALTTKTSWPAAAANCSRQGPQLPLPPMLMFDRISEIAEAGGEYGKGLVRAVLDLKPDLWFFPCHFKGDPVMPGCLGLDALWQLLGFFLGWLGSPGKGRALGLGELKFSGQVLPTIKNRSSTASTSSGSCAPSWCSASPTAGCRPTARSSTGPWTSRSGCSARKQAAAERRHDSAGAWTPVRNKCGRGGHEAGRRHRDGHRLIHRQQHPGSAGEPARGQVRHRARRQVCRARLPLPGARRADARSGRSRSTAARCASSAAAPPGTTSPWSRRSATPASKTARSRTSAPASSWARAGPRPARIVEAADTARTKGPKRVGPFAVPKAMSSTASATLATWFKIKGVNYSISSACATSNHCIGNAMETIQWGKQDIIFAGGCEELDWTLVGAVRRHGRDVVEVQPDAGQGLARL